jgi:hypothetical protein
MRSALDAPPAARTRAPAPALPLAVVGVPDNRRVTLLCAAAERLGLPAPRVVSWHAVLAGTASFRRDELVRVDSPGEDAELARLLRGQREPVDLHRVEGTRAWYAGFTTALDALHARVRANGAVPLFDPWETAVAFDKARCSTVLAAHGVPVPRPLHGVHDYASLRRSMGMAGAEYAYVKIRHGSSASGVVAVTVPPRGPAVAGRSAQRHATDQSDGVRAETSVETTDGALYNSLRFRRYLGESKVRALIDALAPDGLHAEQGVRKLRVGGLRTDLRLVTVDGTVTHAVGRSSWLPVTNLHLGGRRRSAAEVIARCGADLWRTALSTAERAAACFPRSPCLGVDVLIDADAEHCYVAEVNAYGDLLPNLTGLPDTLGAGVDTYTAQLRALIASHG